MATFESKCPLCGKGFQAEDEWVGQVGECPECGKEIKIQAPINIVPIQSPAPRKDVSSLENLKVIKMYKSMDLVVRRLVLFGAVLFSLSICNLIFRASVIEVIIYAIGFIIIFAGSLILGKSFRFSIILAGSILVLITGALAFNAINKGYKQYISERNNAKLRDENAARNFGMTIQEYYKLSKQERDRQHDIYWEKVRAAEWAKKLGMTVEEYSKLSMQERDKQHKIYDEKVRTEIQADKRSEEWAGKLGMTVEQYNKLTQKERDKKHEIYEKKIEEETARNARIKMDELREEASSRARIKKYEEEADRLLKADAEKSKKK